jgi:hypothetical protein
MIGSKESNYVIGIDPNQGGKAKCGVVVIKLGKPNIIVRVLAIDGQTTQEIAVALQDICSKYNIVRIFMDKGGGGKAVADLLEEGYNGEIPIIARDDKDKERLSGRHILDLITFSTSWIEIANYSALSLIEDTKLIFPLLPAETTSDMLCEAYDIVSELKKQCLNIVLTQTTSGALHFDTPKKGQNKDLYSALILACYGVKVLEHELDAEDTTSILYSVGGLVRSRNSLNWQNTSSSSGNSQLSLAVLSKK